MKKPLIYQIYYDDKTSKLIHPEFLPLDNTSNLRPDWFEFWVILNFLRNNELENDRFYGFLSPNFTNKTGLTPHDISQLTNSKIESADVFLLCPNAWDQMSYFLNSWEQGEAWHPGIQDVAQKILDECKIQYDTKRAVTNSYSTVFSNYFLAKKEFWLMWQDLAESFFAFMEKGKTPKSLVDMQTSYRNATYPMKAFVQERLVEIVINSKDFNVIRTGGPTSSVIFETLFKDTENTRFLLNSCDEFKGLYRKTRDSKYLDLYWNSRKQILFTPPRSKFIPTIQVTYSPDFFKRVTLPLKDVPRSER